MQLTGSGLKARLAQLMRKHNVRPIERAPLPLAPPVAKPQIVEGIAASADLDADRMVFQRGSLSWPDDLGKLPLLARHEGERVGRILDLDYDDRGVLRIRARVDDLEAARFGGWSICVSAIESEARNEDSPIGFHFVLSKARIDEISITPIPANPRALVTSRRDVQPWDDRSSYDEALAARGFKRGWKI